MAEDKKAATTLDFTIGRAELLSAITKCAIAIDGKAKSPIVAFTVMLVEAKPEGVRFAAVGERCSVDTLTVAQVKTPGLFHVSPGAFREVAERMPPGAVHITVKGHRVKVKSKISSRTYTFADKAIEIRQIEDPGEHAAWITVSAPAICAAHAHGKFSGTWIYEDGRDGIWLMRDQPPMATLFANNGYTVVLARTGIAMPAGGPLFFPAVALEALALMAKEDVNVRVFADENRLYLENQDTLVSAALGSLMGAQHYAVTKEFLDTKTATAGPTFKLAVLHDSIKSVLVSARFAASGQREDGRSTDRGERVKLAFAADKVRVEVARSEADGFDEFETEEPGEPLAFQVASRFLEGMISSMSGIESAQVLRSKDGMLLLHANNITLGVMEEKDQ